jgi:RLL motif-containing protein 1
MPLELQLSALGYAEPPPLLVAHLAPWLEDRFIRQLSTDDRLPLREGQPGALHAYLQELGAPDLLTGDDRRACAWLVSLALHYEYGDKRDEHEAKVSAAPTEASAECLLAADDPELVGLAAALGVAPCATASDTLAAVVKAARQRPRPAPPAAAPPPKRPAPAVPSGASEVTASCGAPPAAAAASATSDRAPRRARVPLAGLGSVAFPLGFETGSDSVDSAARVLRMLHVSSLRSLQDEINRITATMQEYTANPRADSRLGRVGR